MRLRRTTTPFLTSGKLLRYAKNSPTCFTERGWSCASLRRGWRCPHCGVRSRLASLARRLLLAAPPRPLSLGLRGCFAFARTPSELATAWGGRSRHQLASPKKWHLHPLKNSYYFRSMYYNTLKYINIFIDLCEKYS